MVTRIALTGGPCAGKSTILKRIREKFETKGYAVYLLPEAATLFIEAGADFLTKDAHLSYITEESKLQFQLQMEDSMMHIAENCGKPALLICDRGTMDTAAYMPKEVWQHIKEDIGMNEQQLRNERYDAVLHICTAAKGAEDFYTLYNNKCRSESVEVARDVDDRILAVWQGHPLLRVIKAEICFEDKIQHVLRELEELESQMASQRL